ncbi:MAG: hypothetical protein JWP44_4000 [Mucilaginibacter sp.]|nr:hypothetical protein [Mucilaginibacter sp.]
MIAIKTKSMLSKKVRMRRCGLSCYSKVVVYLPSFAFKFSSIAAKNSSVYK